jgi:hypothetical protein
MTPTSRPHTRCPAPDVTPVARGGEEPWEWAEQRSVRTDGAVEFDLLAFEFDCRFELIFLLLNLTADLTDAAVFE